MAQRGIFRLKQRVELRELSSHLLDHLVAVPEGPRRGVVTPGAQIMVRTITGCIDAPQHPVPHPPTQRIVTVLLPSLILGVLEPARIVERVRSGTGAG